MMSAIFELNLKLGMDAFVKLVAIGSFLKSFVS